MHKEREFMTVSEVAYMLGISTRTVWRMANEDSIFPQPLKLTARTVRFRRSSLKSYIAKVSNRAAEQRRRNAESCKRGSILRLRERQFARSYAMSFNATRAAIDVGYSEKYAHVAGSRLLKKSSVRREIVRCRDEIFSEIEKRKEKHLQAVGDYIDADIADAFLEDLTPKPVKEWPEALRRGPFRLQVRYAKDGRMAYLSFGKQQVDQYLRIYGRHDLVRAFEAPTDRYRGKNQSLDRGK